MFDIVKESIVTEKLEDQENSVKLEINEQTHAEDIQLIDSRQKGQPQAFDESFHDMVISTIYLILIVLRYLIYLIFDTFSKKTRKTKKHSKVQHGTTKLLWKKWMTFTIPKLTKTLKLFDMTMLNLHQKVAEGFSLVKDFHCNFF